MECRLPLVLGLLAWAAAAATGGSAQALACEPPNLATQITLFCMRAGHPTAPCCEPVVASVDLGVSCLCRVAAQPPLDLARLNVSELLALYTACGRLLRTGGAHLAAACQVPSPPAAVPIIAPPPPAAPRHRRLLLPPARVSRPPRGACNSSALAFTVVDQCPSSPVEPPPLGCCAGVLEIVDSADRWCLCRVAEEMGFYDSDMTVDMVWSLYRICGGRQEAVPNDRESCNHVPARSPPPPPPPPPPPRQLPPPPPPSRPARREGLDGWRLALFIASVVVGGSIVVWLSLWLASWLVSLSRTPAAAEVGSTVIPAAGSIGLPVGQQDQVQEAVRASGAGGGLPPIGVQDSPPPAPLRFSPGHIRALVKDLLDHFKWAPPRRNDPASTGPPPTPPIVIQGS